MAICKGLVLAAVLSATAPVGWAATSPEPPMPLRDMAGAGGSALPLGQARVSLPPLVRVLGARPEIKLAALNGAGPGWSGSSQATARDMQPLAIALSVIALAGLGSARRQAVYRWMLRR